MGGGEGGGGKGTEWDVKRVVVLLFKGKRSDESEEGYGYDLLQV